MPIPVWVLFRTPVVAHAFFLDAEEAFAASKDLDGGSVREIQGWRPGEEGMPPDTLEIADDHDSYFVRRRDVHL